MKKAILLLVLFTFISSYAQESKFVEKVESVLIKSACCADSAQQADFIKLVNAYYYEISPAKSISNYYVNDVLLNSELKFNLEGSDYTAYSIIIEPNNTVMHFKLTSKTKGTTFGDITNFNGVVTKILFSEDIKMIQVYTNGKSVYNISL